MVSLNARPSSRCSRNVHNCGQYIEIVLSYISDYLKVVEGTEAPLEFHVWSMLSTLSVFAGRRFWFPFGPFTFYTNLYVVLVGDPGTCKTSALSIGKGIVRATKVCPVAASQITKEALAQKMSSTLEGKPKKDPFEGQRFFQSGDRKVEYNQYAIFATELTQFIGVNPLGFLEFLTAVWDEPQIEVETKHKGHDFVAGPYITMLACMTPDIVKGFLKMNILSSGFARRTAFVFSNTPSSVPIPEFTTEQEAAQLRCVQFGQTLQKFSGAFDWTQDLKDFYVPWYNQNKGELKDKAPALQGWYRSKPEMLFKLSMLVALSENPELRMMDLGHYKTALRFCQMVEKNLERVFEGTGLNPNAAVANQVCRMLEGLGQPMNKKKLIAMFGDQATSWNEFSDTLAHLCTVGRLASREMIENGAILGTLIGTPASLQRPVADLLPFLSHAVSPPLLTNTDQSSEADPPAQPGNPPPDSLPDADPGLIQPNT